MNSDIFQQFPIRSLPPLTSALNIANGVARIREYYVSKDSTPEGHLSEKLDRSRCKFCEAIQTKQNDNHMNNIQIESRQQANFAEKNGEL